MVGVDSRTHEARWSHDHRHHHHLRRSAGEPRRCSTWYAASREAVRSGRQDREPDPWRGHLRHALLQASTGTGKSLAYLIPAILSGKKVVVSTATKALQDQIANKDLPFLAEHLGVEFTHSILKGRSNYLCRAELARISEDDPALATKIERGLKDLAIDDAGEIFEPGFYAEETDFDVTPIEFRKLTVGSGDCPGKSQCPFGETCFSERAKRDAKDADVVVVNHALLCTDLWV